MDDRTVSRSFGAAYLVRARSAIVRRSTILLGVAIVLLAASIPTVSADAVANGRLAFVTSEADQPQVFTINPDGSGQTQVTDRPDGAGENGLSWAPDGSSLLVVLSASRDIMYTMRPDGGDLRRISPPCTGHCLGDDEPAFTRSGTRIAFNRAFGPVTNDNAAVDAIFTMNADGTSVRQLTQKTRPTSTEDHSATWSPDGRRIAFQRLNTTASPVGRSAIYIMSASGTHLRRITPRSLDASNPRWSPDGSRILFNDVAEPTAGKDANIYTVHPDGTDLTKLTSYTDGTAQAFVDDWSPDGSKIVFHYQDTGVDDLYTMDADGSNPLRLTHLGPNPSPRHAAWGTS
jgi:Tol biopolymer transport system component